MTLNECFVKTSDSRASTLLKESYTLDDQGFICRL